ncbi:MAG: hypothetical protein JSV65_18200 [Armatimonadota bacterium]|nr:MAG: hypothetical protein JSV65_18200 [Armatimonadota bacterium]
MSENLVSLVLLLAYAPILLMGLVWMVALGLRLARKPEFWLWLRSRTSVPQPEANPPPEASAEDNG